MTDRAGTWSDEEIIVATDLVRRNGWRDLRRNDPQVIALSELLRSLPANLSTADDPKFRSAGSVSRKVTDIVTAHPSYKGAATKGGSGTRIIVQGFVDHPEDMARVAATIRTEWEQSVAAGRDPFDTGTDVDDTGSSEGRTILAMHLRRERDRGLRDRKIKAVLRAHGSLACEVCGFDFGRTYGDVGENYIEVHHVVPLSASGETVTRLTDLATLCSNCHRMIHRRTPWLTPDDLRALIRKVG